MLRKNLIIILISLLFFKAIFSQDFDCASNFEQIKQLACYSLTTADQYCLLVDNECKEWYKKCEDYKPTGTFDDATCTKITPLTLNKKCSVNEQGGSKTCVTVDMSCEDSSDNTCTGINRGTGKRCIFKGEGEKCQEHSNSCEGLTQNNCGNNIPSDTSMKCSWEGGTCNEVPRKCSEYILFQDSTTYTYELLCSKLEADSSKKCIYTENKKCEEVYPTCESITVQAECQKAKPLTSTNLSYDPLNKCVWAGTNCKTEERKCSDYGKREEDTKDICETLKSDKPGKICSFNDAKNTCEEIYPNCTFYNKVSELFRKKEECEAIDTGSPNYKCEYDGTICTKKLIECKDFTTEESCFAYQPLYQTYKCIFEGGKCKEEPKECKDYHHPVYYTEDEKKQSCESIIAYEDGRYGKCSYEPHTYYECNFESFHGCKGYKGDSEYICNKIYDGSYTKCVMKDKNCTSVPIEITSCAIYVGLIGSDNVTKEGCESVKNSLEYQKCVYNEESKSCITETLLCADYKGKDLSICRKYRASSGYECGIVDGKCAEIKSYIYKYCNNYREKDKEKDICESIQSVYDFSKKCYLNLNDNYCAEKAKNCSDANSEIECVNIYLSNKNKMCIFNGTSCVEQYKSCEAYKNDGGSITKETCESIIIQDDYKKKCQFNEQDNSCKAVNKKCSDFKIDSIANLCYNNTLTDDTKRCSYSNNACSLVYKPTCYELSYSKNATEEICSNAKTNSDYKVCGLKSDKKGCQDYSNPSPTKKTSSQSSQSSSKNGAKYLDVFAIALYCLLV